MSSAGEPAWSDEWRADDEAQRARRSAPGGVRDVVVEQPPATAALVDAARVLSTLDPATLSTDERLGVLDALETVDRILTGASMRHLIAVDERGDLDARFGMTPGAYAEQRFGKDRLTWMATIRRGRSLATRLPEVFAALCAGRISRDRAELIASAVNARNAEVLQAAQQALLDLSDAEPRFREFAHQLRALATIADQDGPEPRPEDSAAKVTRSGAHLAIVMDIYGTDAIAVEQLIDTAVAALRRRWQADIESNPELLMPPGPLLREQAIVELIVRGAAADPAVSKPTVNQLSLVVDADRVDDLDPILAAILSHTGISRIVERDTRGPALRLVDALTDTHDHETCGGCGTHHRPPDRIQGGRVLVTTPDGDSIHLSAQQWQLLLCDADISEILLDTLGEPLAIRDRARFADPKMRTALITRDGGCAYPGCDAHAGWCDAHHVLEHSKNGTTVIVNLVLLCRHHHGIVHRNGWRMERNDDPNATDGFFTITTAAGSTLHTQHRPRPGTPNPPEDPPGEPPERQPIPA